jgi:hypothetical protein
VPCSPTYTCPLVMAVRCTRIAVGSQAVRSPSGMAHRATKCHLFQEALQTSLSLLAYRPQPLLRQLFPLLGLSLF